MSRVGIHQWDWHLKAGDDESLTVAWPSPMVVGSTVKCEVRTAKGGTLLETAANAIADTGTFVEATVSLTPAQTRALLASGVSWYDVQLTAGGSIHTIVEGRVIPDGDVTL